MFAVGILTDFQSRLFPGSQRLVELCDKIEVLQVRALCWCGARATHNARTIDGVMVFEGDQMVVGDTEGGAGLVAYEVLCRRHHRRGVTRAVARATLSDPLPFDRDEEEPRCLNRPGRRPVLIEPAELAELLAADRPPVLADVRWVLGGPSQQAGVRAGASARRPLGRSGGALTSPPGAGRTASAAAGRGVHRGDARDRAAPATR